MNKPTLESEGFVSYVDVLYVDVSCVDVSYVDVLGGTLR